MSPIGPSRRRVLTQSTQVRVVNSTSSSVRHGPRRRIPGSVIHDGYISVGAVPQIQTRGRQVLGVRRPSTLPAHHREHTSMAAHNHGALLLVPMNVQRSSAGSSMIAKSRNIRWLTRFAAVEARSSHRAMVWRAWPVTRAVAEMLTPSTRAGSRPGRIPDERSEGRCTLSPCACCPVPRRPCSGTASVGPTSSETSRGPRC